MVNNLNVAARSSVSGATPPSADSSKLRLMNSLNIYTWRPTKFLFMSLINQVVTLRPVTGCWLRST